MTLEINYNIPSPPASCGYIAKYRQYGAPVYTTVTTTGSTVTAVIDSPCCIEGYIQGDCCDAVSTIAPFGINSYVQIFVDIQVTNTPLLRYQAVVTTEYANPYDTVLTGTFYTDASGGQTLNYTATFPAGETEATITLSSPLPTSINETISDVTITGIAPIFINDGQIQEMDSVTTPEYFKYISTSGYTWEGSPTELPSFTTNSLIALEVEDDTVTQANLLCSWIYDSVYENGDNPYNAVTFEVYDTNNDLIGELRTATGSVGLQNITIFLQRNTVDLNTTNEFTMVCKWDDDSVINSLVFTLPSVTL